MQPFDYMIAGYEGKTLEGTDLRPMWSSSCWFAYEAGKWCRAQGITPKSFAMSRGYSVRINKTMILDFGIELDKRVLK